MKKFPANDDLFASTAIAPAAAAGTEAPTMTSLEMVKFINNQRAVGDAELRHMTTSWRKCRKC